METKSKIFEEWKDIDGYEDIYQVSNLGRIKTLSRVIENKFNSYISKEKIKKQPLSSDGKYLQVTLFKNKKSKTYPVHKLVAVAFLNHQPNGHFVIIDHINNIQTDNRAENLQIISQRQNCSKDKKGYSSKFVGVYQDKKSKRFYSRIRFKKNRFYLGSFLREEDAYQAYLQKLEELTNFNAEPKTKKQVTLS